LSTTISHIFEVLVSDPGKGMSIINHVKGDYFASQHQYKPPLQSWATTENFLRETENIFTVFLNFSYVPPTLFNV